MRYRAFSWSAVERILAAQARPRSGWESLASRGAGTTRRDPPADFPVRSLHGGVSAALEETTHHDEDEKRRPTTIDEPSA